MGVKWEDTKQGYLSHGCKCDTVILKMATSCLMCHFELTYNTHISPYLYVEDFFTEQSLNKVYGDQLHATEMCFGRSGFLKNYSRE